MGTFSFLLSKYHILLLTSKFFGRPLPLTDMFFDRIFAEGDIFGFLMLDISTLSWWLNAWCPRHLGLDGPCDANYRCWYLDAWYPCEYPHLPLLLLLHLLPPPSPRPQPPSRFASICRGNDPRDGRALHIILHPLQNNTPPTSRLQTRKNCIQNVFNYLYWWCYPTSWGPTWPISKQTILFSSNLVMMRISTLYVSKPPWIQFAGNIIAITGVNGCCLQQTFRFNHSAQWQQIQIQIQP